MKTHVIAFVLLMFSFGCQQQLRQQASGARYASRQDRTIILHPSGAHFDIPPRWIDWFMEFHNNLHLTRSELARAQKGEGEWDTEYAAVVNSLLPFDSCLAHLGGEGWAKKEPLSGTLKCAFT